MECASRWGHRAGKEVQTGIPAEGQVANKTFQPGMFAVHSFLCSGLLAICGRLGEINSICQRSGPRERSECRGWGGSGSGGPFLPA